VTFPKPGDEIRRVATVSEMQLLLVAGAWTLYHKGQEYMRLLGAESREEAQQHVSEMLALSTLRSTGRMNHTDCASEEFEM
jgi:hypothetical protein